MKYIILVIHWQKSASCMSTDYETSKQQEYMYQRVKTLQGVLSYTQFRIYMS